MKALTIFIILGVLATACIGFFLFGKSCEREIKEAQEPTAFGAVAERLPIWRIYVVFEGKTGPWPGPEYLTLHFDVRKRTKPTLSDVPSDAVKLPGEWRAVWLVSFDLTDRGFPPYEEGLESIDAGKKGAPQ